MTVVLELNVLIDFLTIIVAVIALFISIFTYKLTRREQRYADIDNLYLEVLKLGIQNPKFRDINHCQNYKKEFETIEERCKYECYAYIVWNICETIFDRKDSELFETWKPVIIAENKLHRQWFDNPENHYKFKKSFRDYVSEEFPKEKKN